MSTFVTSLDILRIPLILLEPASFQTSKWPMMRYDLLELVINA